MKRGGWVNRLPPRRTPNTHPHTNTCAKLPITNHQPPHHHHKYQLCLPPPTPTPPHTNTFRPLPPITHARNSLPAPSKHPRGHEAPPPPRIMSCNPTIIISLSFAGRALRFFAIPLRTRLLRHRAVTPGESQARFIRTGVECRPLARSKLTLWTEAPRNTARCPSPAPGPPLACKP